MAWQIEYEGVTFNESQVTVAHLTMVGEVTGVPVTWDDLDPMRNPQVLAAWIAMAVSQATQEPLDIALTHVVTQPVSKLIAAIHTVDDPALHAVPTTKAG